MSRRPLANRTVPEPTAPARSNRIYPQAAAIAWRGPQRGGAARPAYAAAGPGIPARPSPADASLHPNARRCALGTPALGAAPLRLPGVGRPAEFRGLPAPALLPEQMARPRDSPSAGARSHEKKKRPADAGRLYPMPPGFAYMPLA